VYVIVIIVIKMVKMKSLCIH